MCVQDNTTLIAYVCPTPTSRCRPRSADLYHITQSTTRILFIIALLDTEWLSYPKHLYPPLNPSSHDYMCSKSTVSCSSHMRPLCLSLRRARIILVTTVFLYRHITSARACAISGDARGTCGDF